MKPAWSQSFDPDRLGPAPALDLPGHVTRDWAFGAATGQGVKVAVIDSGIDDHHPAVGRVEGGVTVEPDAGTERGVSFEAGLHDDLYGHGTACAGIIRALAPDVELWSIRVLGPKLRGRARVFAAGIEWAIEHDIRVVNLSLSTWNDDWYGTFHELADRAAFAGVTLVCAMSNEHKATYPAEFSSVLSVAAHSGRDPERFSCNPDPPPEWGAPGIDVDVAWLDRSTVTVTGNSFAAPHIAGHVARIVSTHPTITPYQVKTVLAALADNATQ